MNNVSSLLLYRLQGIAYKVEHLLSRDICCIMLTKMISPCHCSEDKFPLHIHHFVYTRCYIKGTLFLSLINSRILLKYFELAFLQLQFAKISCKLIIISVSCKRKKKHHVDITT